MSAFDEKTLRGKYRVAGYLGPISSCFTFAWLASHRGRLRTLILGGKRLTVIAAWDTNGTARAARSLDDVAAIRQLTLGGSDAD